MEEWWGCLEAGNGGGPKGPQGPERGREQRKMVRGAGALLYDAAKGVGGKYEGGREGGIGAGMEFWEGKGRIREAEEMEGRRNGEGVHERGRGGSAKGGDGAGEGRRESEVRDVDGQSSGY